MHDRQLDLTPRAERDVAIMYGWIAERSRQGADRWYSRFLDLLKSLRSNAETFPLAYEAGEIGLEIREALFKTRKGRFYRVLFVIEGQRIRVLTVRGPGQAPITPDDFEV